MTAQFYRFFFGLTLLAVFAISGCSTALPQPDMSDSQNQPVQPRINSVTSQNLQSTEETNDTFEEMDGFEDFESEFGDNGHLNVYDPLSGYNRTMTTFNDKFYFWALKPIAKGYRWAVPEFFRKGLGNIFFNVLFPKRFVNNVLQLKIRNAGIETVRLLTNSTVGILGFWDPASEWFNMDPQPEDFGQTLGYWGVGPGPHLVLPFYGPSNFRDAISLVPDWYLDPGLYIEDTAPRWGVISLATVNTASLHIGEYENLKNDAVDFYPFMRDIYEQNRKKVIEE